MLTIIITQSIEKLITVSLLEQFSHFNITLSEFFLSTFPNKAILY